MIYFTIYDLSGVECPGTDSLRRQRPVDIITSADGGDLEDSLKARQAFQGRTAASLPLPPPKNGVFKMSSKARLQSLLTRIANQDEFYSGLDECIPDTCGENGPTSFEPFEGSPSSQPPSLYGIKLGFNHAVSRDRHMTEQSWHVFVKRRFLVFTVAVRCAVLKKQTLCN